MTAAIHGLQTPVDVKSLAKKLNADDGAFAEVLAKLGTTENQVQPGLAKQIVIHATQDQAPPQAAAIAPSAIELEAPAIDPQHKEAQPAEATVDEPSVAATSELASSQASSPEPKDPAAPKLAEHDTADTASDQPAAAGDLPAPQDTNASEAVRQEPRVGTRPTERADVTSSEVAKPTQAIRHSDAETAKPSPSQDASQPTPPVADARPEPSRPTPPESPAVSPIGGLAAEPTKRSIPRELQATTQPQPQKPIRLTLPTTTGTRDSIASSTVLPAVNVSAEVDGVEEIRTGNEGPAQPRQPALSRAQTAQSDTPSPLPKFSMGGGGEQQPAPAQPSVVQAPASSDFSMPAAAPNATQGGAVTTIASPVYVPGSQVPNPQFQQDFTAHIVRMIQTGEQQATLKLNPEDIGPVTIELKTADKQVQVSLLVSQLAAKPHIEQALPQLREGLAEAGLELSDADVHENEGSFAKQREEREEREEIIRVSGASDSNPRPEDETGDSSVNSITSGVSIYA